MDPNECLKELLEVMETVRARNDESEYHHDPDIERLDELVTALDGWLSKGGALPETWRQAK